MVLIVINSEISTSELTEFIGISRRLLGLAEDEFIAFDRREGLAIGLLGKLRHNEPAALAELLEAFDADLESSCDTILQRTSPAAQTVSHSLLLGWLLGKWFPLDGLAPSTDATKALRESEVIDAGAYRDSLVWPLIGATPMGVPHPSHEGWTRALDNKGLTP